MANFMLIDGALVNLEQVVRVEFEPTSGEPKTRVFVSCSDGVAIDVRDERAPELYHQLVAALKPKGVAPRAAKKAAKAKPGEGADKTE